MVCIMKLWNLNVGCNLARQIKTGFVAKSFVQSYAEIFLNIRKVNNDEIRKKRVLDILFLSNYGVTCEDSYHNVVLRKEKGEIYDAVFCFNQVPEDIHIETYNGNVFAVMQEPGIEGVHRFMYEKLNQYDRVFSSIVNSENTIQDIPYLIGCLQREEALNLTIPYKKKMASCIASNEQFLTGHKKRYDFVWNFLVHQGLDIDFYGKGINYIEKKQDGLIDYKYSIAIENSQQDFYFTEKIIDCFLCYTVPIYCGCTNISKFFPEKSYIQIDIDEPQKALDMIRGTLSNDDYSARLPYLEEARNLIFEEYNLARLIEKLEPEIFANIEKNQIERRYLESFLEKDTSEVKINFLEVKTDVSQKSLKRRIWDTSRKMSQKLGLYEALRPLAKFTKSIVKRR